MSTSRPIALITSDTTRIGHATARLLHEQGFEALVIGTKPETLPAAQVTGQNPHPFAAAL
jgi:NAD(P)-dependent dehydrogenase (short-subunit alcohol dehydrogenase family)